MKFVSKLHIIPLVTAVFLSLGFASCNSVSPNSGATPSPTPVATPTPDTSTIAGFETDTGGFNNGNATYWAATDPATAYAQNTVASFVKIGTGSLKVTANFTKYDWSAAAKAVCQAFYNPNNISLQGKTISLWIYAPTEMVGYKANLVAKDSSWSQISTDNWTTLAAGWNKLSIDSTATSAAGWLKVAEIDVEVAAQIGTFSGSYYIDGVTAQ